VGPIGVLCIRRTLASGRTSGLASGLGAATADALYGSVAAFRSRFSLKGFRWVNRISGLVIVGFGLMAWFSLGG